MAATLILEPAEKNMIRNPIWVTIETDQMSGAEPPYTIDQDNLSCVCEVWHDPLAGDPVLLGRLRAPYSTDDKRATFDIASLVRFPELAIPSEASIGVSPSTPLGEAAPYLTRRIHLAYADAYGTPVVTEALTETDIYLCIDGGLPADAVQDINWAGPLLALHSYLYKRNSAYILRKPVSKAQPDWIYFITQVADNVDVIVTIHYSDGTYEFYTAINNMAVVINRGYWVQAGYNQLKVDDNANPGKTVIGYDVSLVRVTGEVNAYTQFYVVDDMCPSWERYILYQNGMGGYETVRMKGVTRYSHEVQRDRFERTPWTDFDIKTGVIDEIRVRGGAVYNTHTGHYPSWYVEHLRQMMHGKMWLIDMELSDLDEYRFKRIVVDNTTVDIRSDIPAADGFALTYRHAWKDDGFNIF